MSPDDQISDPVIAKSRPASADSVIAPAAEQWTIAMPLKDEDFGKLCQQRAVEHSKILAWLQRLQLLVQIRPQPELPPSLGLPDVGEEHGIPVVAGTEAGRPIDIVYDPQTLERNRLGPFGVRLAVVYRDIPPSTAQSAVMDVLFTHCTGRTITGFLMESLAVPLQSDRGSLAALLVPKPRLGSEVELELVEDPVEGNRVVLTALTGTDEAGALKAYNEISFTAQAFSHLNLVQALLPCMNFLVKEPK